MTSDGRLSAQGVQGFGEGDILETAEADAEDEVVRLEGGPEPSATGVVAYHPDFGWSGVVPIDRILASGGAVPAVEVDRPLGVLDGQLLDSTGRGIGGVEVTVSQLSSDGDDDRPAWLAGANHVETIRTRSDGGWRVCGLIPTGEYEIRATGQVGPPNSDRDLANATAVAGGPPVRLVTDLVRLVVLGRLGNLAQADGRMTVGVEAAAPRSRDGAGRLPEIARVRDWQVVEGETLWVGAGRRYRIETDEPSRAYAATWIDVPEAGSMRVELPLDPIDRSAAVRVEVRGSDGKGVTPIAVRVERRYSGRGFELLDMPYGPDRYWWLSTNGKIPLEPGSYHIDVVPSWKGSGWSGDDWHPTRWAALQFSVDVAAGDTANVSRALRQGAPLTVGVVLADGAAAAMGLVSPYAVDIISAEDLGLRAEAADGWRTAEWHACERPTDDSLRKQIDSIRGQAHWYRTVLSMPFGDAVLSMARAANQERFPFEFRASDTAVVLFVDARGGVHLLR